MKKISIKNNNEKLWQRLLAQLLFCAIILISSTKKVFGLIPNDIGSEPYPPPALTITDLIFSIFNTIIVVAYFLGIFLYLFYFYLGNKDKNIEKRNEYFKKITTILFLITFLYALLLVIFAE